MDADDACAPSYDSFDSLGDPRSGVTVWVAIVSKRLPVLHSVRQLAFVHQNPV